MVAGDRTEEMPVKIEYADIGDFDYLARQDDHIAPAVLKDKVDRREVIVVRVDGRAVGWLRYGYFWDMVPFMNLLFVEADCRNRGHGTGLITFWENEMRARGHHLVMTSTQADELAQHLYRRLGYRDCGSMLVPGQIPLEIVLVKSLE